MSYKFNCTIFFLSFFLWQILLPLLFSDFFYFIIFFACFLLDIYSLCIFSYFILFVTAASLFISSFFFIYFVAFIIIIRITTTIILETHILEEKPTSHLLKEGVSSAASVKNANGCIGWLWTVTWEAIDGAITLPPSPLFHSLLRENLWDILQPSARKLSCYSVHSSIPLAFLLPIHGEFYFRLSLSFFFSPCCFTFFFVLVSGSGDSFSFFLCFFVFFLLLSPFWSFL